MYLCVFDRGCVDIYKRQAFVNWAPYQNNESRVFLKHSHVMVYEQEKKEREYPILNISRVPYIDC